VDSRAGLGDAETLPGLEFLLLGRPARSQSLYRLRYPGSLENMKYSQIHKCVSVNKLVTLGQKSFLQGVENQETPQAVIYFVEV
jgi:hypothetical protein